MKVLVFGASSGVGSALLNRIEGAHDVHTFGRQPLDRPQHHYFDAMDLENSLPDIEDIDALVYFPGSIHLKPLQSLKVLDIQQAFQKEVLSIFQILQHYRKSFNEGANILLMSSVAAQKGMAFHAQVGIVKGALEGLVRSLAAEWAPKVKINALAPSIIDTPLAAQLLSSDEKRARITENHPLKRILSPEEVAELASYYLLNNKAITGQVLKIDNGIGH